MFEGKLTVGQAGRKLVDPTPQRNFVGVAGPTLSPRNPPLSEAVSCGGVMKWSSPDITFIHDFYLLGKMNGFVLCHFEGIIMTRE